MMKTCRRAVVACLVAGAAFMSSASADALPEKGPNGGLLREAGDHHIELLVKDRNLTVHLLDHKNKASAEPGVTGKATVSAPSFVETIVLTAQANGVFTGTGKFPAAGPLKVDVTLNPPGESALSVSFDVKR